MEKPIPSAPPPLPSRGSPVLGSALALAAGAVVGAGLALLYAPEIGRDLRARLSLGYERLAQLTKSKPAVHGAADASHDGKHEVTTGHVPLAPGVTDGHVHPNASHA